MRRQLCATPIAVLFFAFIAFAAGCAAPPQSIYSGYPSGAKIPLKVAVNVTDELRNPPPTVGLHFTVGETFAKNTPELARHVFTEVSVVNSGKIPDSADALLTAKVISSSAAAAGSFRRMVCSFKLEWTLSDRGGNTIWVDTITGEASQPEHRDPLKGAWENVLINSQRALSTAQAIRDFAQRKNSVTGGK